MSIPLLNPSNYLLRLVFRMKESSSYKTVNGKYLCRYCKLYSPAIRRSGYCNTRRTDSKKFIVGTNVKITSPFFQRKQDSLLSWCRELYGYVFPQKPSPPNYTRYNNPVFDKLYEQALMENNDFLRYKLYRKMDQLVINDVPVIPIWYDMAIHLIQPNVKGFYPNSLNLLESRRTKINN